MTQTAVYTFAEGSRLPQKRAQEVGEYFETLGITGDAGEQAVEIVLADAKRPTSPLNDLFTWDDSEAAQEWRRHEARRLIGSIRVRFVNLGSEAPPVAAFVNLRTKNEEAERPMYGQRYVPIQRALSESDLRAQLLEQALAEARAWRRRYSSLKELSEVFVALEAVGAMGVARSGKSG